MLDKLSILVPVLVVISLASERLIAIIKSVFPGLQEERKTPAGDIDLQADRRRQLSVQVLAFVTSYISVALAFGKVSPIDGVAIGDVQYSVAALALLGSGGSAFWNNILGYTKAVKDIKTADKAKLTLQNRLSAKDAGYATTGAGVAAKK